MQVSFFFNQKEAVYNALLCRYKLFDFFSSPKGLCIALAANMTIVINYLAYVLFALWPTKEIVDHLKQPTTDIVGIDLVKTPLVAACLKVGIKVGVFFKCFYSATFSVDEH